MRNWLVRKSAELVVQADSASEALDAARGHWSEAEVQRVEVIALMEGLDPDDEADE